MFALAHHPYTTPYQSHNPYAQLFLQQELQRRRNAEVYRRQLEIEELNRQYEYACRQAELQRQQMAMEMGRAAQTRKLNGRGRSCCHSMFGGGVQDLVDALYGSRVRSMSPCDQRSTPAECDGSQGHIALEHADVKKAVVSSPQTSVEPSESTVVPPLTLSTEPIFDEPTEITGIDVDASHATVSGILETFTSLSSNFTFPLRLEFIPAPSSDSPKLAYTPVNAPLHQYEHMLTGLLTRLDAVESFGDEAVRKVRKEAVKRIEKELEELDRRKMEEWKRQSATVAEPVVESNSEANASFAEVDPSQVPLPQDEGDEKMYDSIPTSPVVVLATALSPSHSSFMLLLPTAAESGQASLAEASAPICETCDFEAEEYVNVNPMSGTSTNEETGEPVERTSDLAAMDEWDLDF